MSPGDILTSLHWNPPGGVGWLFVLLALAAVVYAVFVYRRTEAPLTPAFRGLLTALRALLLLLVLAVLCRPVLSLALPSGAERGVLVLLDRSASMLLPAGDGDGTRNDRLAAARDALATELAAYPLTFVPFGQAADEPLPAGAPLPPADRPGTSLAAALEQGISAAETRPGAVVLVTDGVQTEGADPVPEARRLGLPVSTVALGSARPVSDLALVRVRANREAFLGERTPVEAVLRLQGLPADEVAVTLVDVTDGEPVELARTEVTLDTEGAERRVALPFTPGTTGLRFLEVRVTPVDGQATAANDRRLFAMDVREDKTAVLLLSGSLTWDHTFARRALEQDSTLAVSAGVWREGSFRSAASRESLPALDAASLRAVGVVVLDHVGPAQITPPGAAALAEFVRGGGGLVLLQGAAPLSAWQGTPLEPLLPVRLGPGNAAGDAVVRLSQTARRHALFDPSAPGAAALEAWSDLPPVSLAPGAGSLKGHAEALLVPDGGSGAVAPVVSWAPSGEGSVLLLAGGGFWKWSFLNSSHRPAGDPMPGWWRRTAQWMARPKTETRLTVHPAEPVVSRGQSVRFVARALDAAYRPLTDVEVDLLVSPADDPSTEAARVSLSGGDGFLTGDAGALPPGRYVYRASAAAGADAVGAVEGAFAVDSLGAEMERLEADPELLRRLAEATGGAAWTADSLDTVDEDLRVVSASEADRAQVDLWNHPVLFALVVLVGSMEWFLRRRRGLI